MTTSEEKKSGTEDTSQSGEKLDGLIQDINLDDIKDLPEETQKIIKEKLTQKVKLYDAGFRTRTEDVATQKKELESRATSLRELETLQKEIQGNPDMEKAVTKTINDFRAGRTDNKVDKNLKKLDQLIDKAADADQREQLKTMREIIREETSGGNSSEKIKSLEDKIVQLEKMNLAGLSGAIQGSMKDLEDRFGDEIVTKYKPQIETMLKKYPSYLQTPSKVLFSLAEDSEIFEAHEKIKAKQIQAENQRKEAGTFPGGDSKPSKVEIPRLKGGRVDTAKYIENLEAAGKFK